MNCPNLLGREGKIKMKADVATPGALVDLPNGDLLSPARPHAPLTLPTVAAIADYNRLCQLMFEDVVFAPHKPLRMPGTHADEAYEMARDHRHFGEDQ